MRGKGSLLRQYNAGVHEHPLSLTSAGRPLLGAMRPGWKRMTATWSSCNPTSEQVCLNLGLVAQPPGSWRVL